MAKILPGDREALQSCVDALSKQSDEPAALFASAKLGEALSGAPPRAAKGFGGDVGEFILDTFVHDTAAETFAHVPSHHGAGLYSITLNAAFASAWAGFWWRARALGKNVLSAHPDIPAYIKSRNTGRRLFGLLALDMLAQRLLKFASTDNMQFEFKHLDNDKLETRLINTTAFYSFLKEANALINYPGSLPLSSVYPTVETALFGMASVWLIRTQRFVALPLMIALAYNHRDVLEKNETFQDVSRTVVDSVPSEWLTTLGLKEASKKN